MLEERKTCRVKHTRTGPNQATQSSPQSELKSNLFKMIISFGQEISLGDQNAFVL
jgi:hypothetical protein